MKKLLFALFISGFIISCTGTPSIGLGTGFMGINTGISFSNLGFAKKDKTVLIENNWVLEKYEVEGNLKSVEKDSKINIVFEKEKLYGNGGVNGFFGDYKIDGNTFETFGPFGRTMMAGDDSLMNQENIFMRLLEKSKTFKIEKDKLYLLEGKKEILVFNKEKK